MAYRFIQTQTGGIFVNRMGSQRISFPTLDDNGTSLNLSGSTAHLWLAIPAPTQPIPANTVQVNPAAGWSFGPGLATSEFTEADFASWGIGPGSYGGQLLVTNDGGVTTDVLWQGTLTVNNGWITAAF